MVKILKYMVFLWSMCILCVVTHASPAVIVTKDAVTITNKYSTGKAGEIYSVDMYDSSYTAENPLPSLVYRNQGVSTTDGWCNMLIPMTGEEYGIYRIATGETTGKYSTINALYDGFDGEKTYSNVDIKSDGSMDLSSSSYIETDFNELISNKIVNISFDINVKQDSQILLSLNNCQNAVWNDKNQIFDTLLFGDDGKFGLFTKDNNGTLASNLFDYDYGKTYHIELNIDMLKHSLKCYIDNELFDTIELNDGFEKLGGFRITCSKGGAILSNLNSEVAELEPGERLSVNVKSNAKVGNIYFDESNVSFDISAVYAGKSNAKYNVRYEIYNEENGVLIGEAYDEISFAANEQKQFVKSFDFNAFDIKYGLFELKLVFEYVGGEGSYETEKYRFSVARESEEANLKLGMHTQFGHGYSDAELNAYLMNKAGFSGIRDYLAYSQCFANGVWSEPSRYNNWVDDISDYNLSQIIEFPTEDIGFPKTDAEIDEYVRYTVAVVENLTQDGVYMYELGNELNWTCTAEEYAELLIKVAPAIHSVDENVKILAFATAGINNFHSVNWIVDVIDIIKEKGLEPHDYIDYITVHPYRALNQYPEKTGRTCDCTYGTESYPELTIWQQMSGKVHPDPKDTIKGDSSLVARMDNLFNRLKEADCDDIPIIATELGWYSYEGASSQTNCEECVANEVTSLTETGQAQYVLRATALLYNKLDKIYYHTLNNKPNSAGTMEKNFGFTENWSSSETEIPYEAKPVFIAMANFNAMLGNAELVFENISGKNYDYVFSKDGKTIHMLWTTNISSEFVLNIGGDSAKAYDMYGNEISVLRNSVGEYIVPLSGSPVYIEEVKNIPEINITDANGNILKEIGDSNGFGATLNLPEKSKDSVVVICALYSDGILVKVTQKKVEVGEQSVTTDIIFGDNIDEVKAFYWEEDKQMPYCESESIR